MNILWLLLGVPLFIAGLDGVFKKRPLIINLLFESIGAALIFYWAYGK